uniref:Putative theta replicase n=2 Tax=Rhodococcus TaxID=1827 RepID=Q9XBN1_RHORH|nr:replication initiation protein [Rhodococcus sp. B264-1]AAD43817.1 putative theta replicase [Rhodococcus rhodochrous]AAP58733.1 putative theta replicase [Rhodococcus sp. B264-1]
MWLPFWPLATNDFLEGVYRMRRPAALERRYIEANPQTLSNLLVVDVDHPDSALRALSAAGNHPMPNAVIENSSNGHAHLHWWLREPFTRTEYARRKPLAYAAAVTEGLRRAVEGDIGYSGLMTKNPTHSGWDTHWIHTEPRSLAELEAELGTHMPSPRWQHTKAHRDAPIGLGRNCAIFHAARTWATRPGLMRNYLPTHDSAGLELALHREVTALNASYTEELPPSEARAIAASIHRWITTRSRIWKDGIAVYEATLSTIQSARGRKGGVASGQARRARSTKLDQVRLAIEEATHD